MEEKPWFTPNGVSHLAFHPELDESGQLKISPRHRRMTKWADRQCPAVTAKTSNPEGNPSALLLFMKTIGAVATEEIYPQQFEIIK